MAKNPCDNCQADTSPVCICAVVPPITQAKAGGFTEEEGEEPTPPTPPTVPQPIVWYAMRNRQVE